MSGIHLDLHEALAVLARLQADGEDQHRRHVATSPSFPIAAAGRDFADRGQAIAHMLQRVHNAGTLRIDAVRATADAGVAQVQVYGGVDKLGGAQLEATE
ncbi:hypothetical protein HCH15_05070 [Corynebacterium testudinoris]|uniref:Uncharacterized protein n=1 Tax=Corynebacterium testudinoris TaxID=136857 RepID=A0A0G3H3E7_9CORY|nr:hypothetical protein [Corynebacterium testudinoris]AKK07929.1 hypothetical protein CTEST_02370 [Corynebacterium testudinoris]MBX8995550.1 hypothetical protein [Corynebacterium testudinoris]